MNLTDVLALTAGVLLAMAVLVDVFLTTLHPDAEGPIARSVQRAIWRVSARLGGRFRNRSRQILATAGPLMTAATFVVWIGVFIVGYALIVMPFLDSYRAAQELERLSFVDALYYAGVTITVLGYGDITPLGGPLKILTFVGSASGFALLTGIVAYMIEIIGSISDRNRFALRVVDETGGSSGVDLIVRSVASEGTSDLKQRYEAWAGLLRAAQDKLHRYALVALYYRSSDPDEGPERGLRLAAEATIAGHLLASSRDFRSLYPSVASLEAALNRTFVSLAEQYLPNRERDRVVSPSVEDEDRRFVAELAERLTVDAGIETSASGVDGAAAVLSHRARAFIEGLETADIRSEEDLRVR